MTCRSCGTNIAEKAIVCYKCGTPTADLASMPRHAPARRPTPWMPVLAVLIVVGISASGVWLLRSMPEESWARTGLLAGLGIATFLALFVLVRVSRTAGSGRLRRK